MQCPCGTGKKYLECCDVFISGKENPATPEQLMRSRYTAYHNQEFGYIAKTMLPPAANHFDLKEVQQSAKTIKWTKLEVIKAHDNIVEFKAHFQAGKAREVMHEVSTFKQVDGIWYYTDGIFP